MDDHERQIGEQIANRNVEQMKFTADALHRLPRARQMPGSRSDGGMASAAATTHNTRSLIDQIMLNEQQLRQELSEARQLIENLEANILQMEDTIIELKNSLGSENVQREHFENMLRQIATLVVNGAKDKPA